MDYPDRAPRYQIPETMGYPAMYCDPAQMLMEMHHSIMGMNRMCTEMHQMMNEMHRHMHRRGEHREHRHC